MTLLPSRVRAPGCSQRRRGDSAEVPRLARDHRGVHVDARARGAHRQPALAERRRRGGRGLADLWDLHVSAAHPGRPAGAVAPAHGVRGGAALRRLAFADRTTTLGGSSVHRAMYVTRDWCCSRGRVLRPTSSSRQRTDPRLNSSTSIGSMQGRDVGWLPSPDVDQRATP